MIIPDFMQFILIIVALTFMSASTLFISAGRKEKKAKEKATITVKQVVK